MGSTVMVFDGRQDLVVDLETGTIVKALPRWEKAQPNGNYTFANKDKYRVPANFVAKEMPHTNKAYNRAENIIPGFA